MESGEGKAECNPREILGEKGKAGKGRQERNGGKGKPKMVCGRIWEGDGPREGEAEKGRKESEDKNG